MKKLSDLFALILTETEMNNGKMSKYFFSVDTYYGWVSMTNKMYIGDEEKEQVIFSHMCINTESSLQQVYWTIYNNGRSSK